MKFWKNNRLDAEFDLPIEQVAVLFAESQWADVPWLIDRRMCAFLTDTCGPISAVWDDQASYDQLADLALAAERKQIRTATQAGQSSLPELLDTWRQWNLASTVADAASRQEAASQPEKAAVLASWLDGEPRVDPLDALSANHRLAGLLTGWQWLAIHAARTQGASWEQIGAALQTSGQQARAGYLAKIERAERHNPDFFTAADSAEYRAVLDGPTPSAGPGPAAADGRCQR